MRSRDSGRIHGTHEEPHASPCRPAKATAAATPGATKTPTTPVQANTNPTTGGEFPFLLTVALVLAVLGVRYFRLRRTSPTFGRWTGSELSGENHRQMWIPPGLAHGFLVLSESADFLYKTTTYYAPAAERTIRWDDAELAIAWPDIGMAPIVSAKDAAALSFAEFRSGSR